MDNMNPSNARALNQSQLVYAIGELSYDFNDNSKLETVVIYMQEWYRNLPQKLKDELTNNPHDEKTMAAFLLYKKEGNYAHIFLANRLIWILTINTTPLYAIGGYNDFMYEKMVQYLAEKVGLDTEKYSKYLEDLENGTLKNEASLPVDMFMKNKDKDNLARIALPGYVTESVTLRTRNSISVVESVVYGLGSWSLQGLKKSNNIAEANTEQLEAVLYRSYVSMLNSGLDPEDRALNYAFYCMIYMSDILEEVIENKLQLSGHKVIPSKITRPNAIVRDVELTFFDPSNTNQPSTTYSLCIDVSDMTPVLVGRIQKWKTNSSVISS